jgi:Fic family protein
VVVVKKKTVDGRDYFYLQHTIRTPTGVQAREKYLGTKLPSNVETAKRNFLTEIYRGRWYPLLDQVRSNYQKENRTLPPSALQKRDRQFSVKFTYDTNRIEGSTLTYRETADLLENGLSPSRKPVGDIKEAEAHDRVFQEALRYEKDLSMRAILMWHKRLFEETKSDIAGRVRTHQVAISGSRFIPPSPVEVQPLLREFFRWYDRNKRSMHPVELAAGAHLRFVSIHPFADGNGRMSRLLMNFVLHRHGFPPLNIPYEGRRGYYSALERSQVKENDSTFIQWFFRRYLKEHSEYAKVKR